VEAVRGYYARFLEALPTVAHLACADDELLHKLWEGLGYYSRVRNLKKAAQIVMQQHNGIFPDKPDEIRALPGIGPYTAGAVCSIAFDQKRAAVDGNVLRVMARLTADDTPIDRPAYKKQVQAQLEQIYPDAAGDFTQALMELGATVCGPNWTPRCAECPCVSFCKAAADDPERYPVKAAKRPRKTEEMTVFILSFGNEFALQKRPDKGLLAGLWQFPNVQGKLQLPAAIEYLAGRGVAVRDVYRQVEKKHIFTHIEWKMTGFYLETSEKSSEFVWMNKDEINEKAALPTAFRQFWEDMNDV
jgi:A/G-specific adenine glycosylase